MKTIQELCKEIAVEQGIAPRHCWVNLEGRLEMQDILPRTVWLEPGVTCLASRPLMRKSSLVEDILLDAAMWMQKPVVYFSMAVDEKRLVYRLVNKVGGVDCRWKIGEEAKEKVAAAIDFLADLPIIIDDTAGISTAQVERVLKEVQNPGLVIVDDIQLMLEENHKEFSSREEEIRKIMKDISGIAKSRSMPCLVLSLLPRDLEFRKNKRPCLDDLCREAFDLNDVDNILFLYREEYYRGENYGKETGDDSAEIIVAKSKTGETKTIRARWDETYFRFCKNEDYDFIVQKEYNGIPIQYAVIHGEIPQVLLIKGGQNSSVYGFHNKYLNVAKRVNAVCRCTVVVSSNPYDRTDALEDAVQMIKELVCNKPEIYFMGNSNGAVLGARYACLHPEIKRMLLVNAPLMINWPQTKRGAEQFAGEKITFVYGEQDPSYKYLQLLDVIEGGCARSVITVEGADHNFADREEEFLKLPERYLFD